MSEMIDKLFKQNPVLEVVFQTEDGQVFLTENYARLHQRTGNIKVIKRLTPVQEPLLSDLEITDEFEPELIVPNSDEKLPVPEEVEEIVLKPLKPKK